MPVILRYDDPSLRGGYRYSVFDSAEEALAQAAHDQARDGRRLGVKLYEAVEAPAEAITVIGQGFALGDPIKVGDLAAATKRERRRLERAGDQTFDAENLIAGLTPSEFDRLRAAIDEASS